MPQQQSDQEKLVDSLLESLEYGKQKEDTAIIQHLCKTFKVPSKRMLQEYLIKKVDFSELFVVLLRLTEPFARMMNDIYVFLAAQRKTARTLEHLVVGENIKDKISFDLEAFPQRYQPTIQQIEGYLQIISLDKVLNDNISPLFLTEGLLGCGFCTDIHYQKTLACIKCGTEMQLRFKKEFQQLEGMISIIPEDVKLQRPYSYLCGYFETANERLRTGTHRDGSCSGYHHWRETLDEVERRIDLVSEKRVHKYDVTVLLRFFELPFWKRRHRLYEIWTLTHFLHLLRGVTFDLNIKNGQWHLMYGDAREPIAWVYGQGVKIEV